MPLGIYLENPRGRTPATLPSHFTLNDFRAMIQKKVGNPDHFDYSLGDVIFRTWNEEVFDRQRSAIHDGIVLIVQYPTVGAEGPAWRQPTPGLCLEGVCLNIECDAFESKVIINRGIGTFNVVTNSSSCPLCSLPVQPTVCAFNRCSWRLVAAQQKSPDSPSMPINEWQNATEGYHRWPNSVNACSLLTVETQGNK